MKKYLSIFTIALIISILIFQVSCKKEDDNNLGGTPSYAYRMVKQEVNFYDDTTNYIVKNAFEDSKLTFTEYITNNEVESRSFYSYVDNFIYRLDSNYYLYNNDSMATLNVQFELQNDLIVKSTTDNDFLEMGTYSYSGENLIKWEYFSIANNPLIKGEYEYQGDRQLAYAFYTADHDGVWDLSSRNEYTYKDDRINEILFYIRFVDYSEPDLIMKRQFVYNGDTPESIKIYYRTLEDEWELEYITRLTYNKEGYLSKVEEYATDGVSEYLYYDVNYTYESGDSNLDIFYKIQTDIPLSDLGFPLWGFHSVGSSWQPEKLMSRKIAR